jgi:hypothetical protein
MAAQDAPKKRKVYYEDLNLVPMSDVLAHGGLEAAVEAKADLEFYQEGLTRLMAQFIKSCTKDNALPRCDQLVKVMQFIVQGSDMTTALEGLELSHAPSMKAAAVVDHLKRLPEDVLEMVAAKSVIPKVMGPFVPGPMQEVFKKFGNVRSGSQPVTLNVITKALKDTASNKTNGSIKTVSDKLAELNFHQAKVAALGNCALEAIVEANTKGEGQSSQEETRDTALGARLRATLAALLRTKLASKMFQSPTDKGPSLVNGALLAQSVAKKNFPVSVRELKTLNIALMEVSGGKGFALFADNHSHYGKQPQPLFGTLEGKECAFGMILLLHKRNHFECLKSQAMMDQGNLVDLTEALDALDKSLREYASIHALEAPTAPASWHGDPANAHSVCECNSVTQACSRDDIAACLERLQPQQPVGPQKKASEVVDISGTADDGEWVEQPAGNRNSRRQNKKAAAAAAVPVKQKHPRDPRKRICRCSRDKKQCPYMASRGWCYFLHPEGNSSQPSAAAPAKPAVKASSSAAKAPKVVQRPPGLQGDDNAVFQSVINRAEAAAEKASKEGHHAKALKITASLSQMSTSVWKNSKKRADASG